MPGSITSTFFAFLDPILITPTLSSLEGVPGAANPSIHFVVIGIAALLAAPPAITAIAIAIASAIRAPPLMLCIPSPSLLDAPGVPCPGDLLNASPRERPGQ